MIFKYHYSTNTSLMVQAAVQYKKATAKSFLMATKFPLSLVISHLLLMSSMPHSSIPLSFTLISQTIILISIINRHQNLGKNHNTQDQGTQWRHHSQTNPQIIDQSLSERLVFY